MTAFSLKEMSKRASFFNEGRAISRESAELEPDWSIDRGDETFEATMIL